MGGATGAGQAGAGGGGSRPPAPTPTAHAPSRASAPTPWARDGREQTAAVACGALSQSPRDTQASPAPSTQGVTTQAAGRPCVPPALWLFDSRHTGTRGTDTLGSLKPRG